MVRGVLLMGQDTKKKVINRPRCHTCGRWLAQRRDDLGIIEWYCRKVVSDGDGGWEHL